MLARFADAASPSDAISMKGISLRGAPLYLDMQSTTPMDPRVVDIMIPYMTEQFGNPHSRTHLYGWEADAAVEAARGQVREAALLLLERTLHSQRKAYVCGKARQNETTVVFDQRVLSNCHLWHLASTTRQRGCTSHLSPASSGLLCTLASAYCCPTLLSAVAR